MAAAGRRWVYAVDEELCLAAPHPEKSSRRSAVGERYDIAALKQRK